MTRLILAAALVMASWYPNHAIAAGKTPPSSVRLTREQWQCLGTRVDNLLRSSNDVVRVPLSPCGAGSGVRGPGASNVTAGAGNPTSGTAGNSSTADPSVTRAPLYLKKSHLQCIQRQLPSLTASNGASTVDLSQCGS